MRIVRDSDVPIEEFPGGATYRTLVGDDAGSTPVRTGIQTSPPGYATADHSHPYVEIITVLEEMPHYLEAQKVLLAIIDEERGT